MTQLLQAGLLTVGAGVVLLSCAGLMLFSKLRSCEVLALEVRAADIPTGGVRVRGKGDKSSRG